MPPRKPAPDAENPAPAAAKRRTARTVTKFAPTKLRAPQAASAAEPPATASSAAGGLLSHANLSGVVFLLAMLLLGSVLGVLYLNARPKPAPGPGAAAHHTLDSPYSARPFFHGAASAQSADGGGHAAPRNLSFDYLTRGYQWFSLTDVNTATPAKQYETAGLLAVAGEEVSYPFGGFLAYGVDRFQVVDTPQKAIDWIHADAGSAFLSTPLAPPAPGVKAIAALHGLDGIQIYNARVAHEQPSLGDATALWDQLLTAGDRLWGIAGDDTLDSTGPASTLGKTAVDVQVAEQTAVLVEAALKQGAFVCTTGVRVLGVADDNDTITVVTTNANEIKFIGTGGKLLQVSHGTRGDYHMRWNEGYVRAEATRTSDGAKAWTQPIFVNP